MTQKFTCCCKLWNVGNAAARGQIDRDIQDIVCHYPCVYLPLTPIPMLVLVLIKSMNIRVTEEIMTPISHNYHSPLHFHPISACTSFSLYNYNFCTFLNVCVSHVYTLSIFILVLGRMTFGFNVCICTTAAMFFYALCKCVLCPP